MLFVVVAFLSGLGAQPVSELKPLKIFLLAGQSNMVGYTSVEWVQKNAQELVKPRDDVWCYWQRKCAPLAPGMGHKVGPELPFGHVVGDATDQPVLLCKFASGGTTLHEKWRPPSAVARAGGEIGFLYKNMIKKFYRILSDPGKFCPAYKGQGYELAGFIWFQGENDCFKEMWNHYEANLKDLIKDVRTACASPDLPIIIVQINDSGVWDKAGGGGPFVRAAQQKVAESDKNADWVNTKDLGEGYHYSDGDHVAIGRRIGSAMVHFVNKTAVTDPKAIQESRRNLDKLFYPGRGPLPPEPDVHLSDLKWNKGTAGWGGDPRINKSIEDRPLSIDDKPYAKGIGTHAESELEYPIEPTYERFVAIAGIDDEMGMRGVPSVVFQVMIDGKKLAESVVMKPQEVWHFDVKIPAGSKTLTLKVLEADSGTNSDHADWVQAGFVVKKE